MDQDILQAIRIIDNKIASLREARDRLATAFGIEDISSHNTRRLAAPGNTASVPVMAAQNGHAALPPLGRKEQLAKFLLERGPMARSTLVEQAGIPEGTVSYCLNDKRFFEQTASGDWTLTEFSRRGLERRAKTGTFHEEHQ